MEFVRHWRGQRDRYNLRGKIRELEDGKVQFKLNGSNTWTEPQPNGHHRGENPMSGGIIYQAEKLSNDNGREPSEIQDSVEISASSD